jgi:DinB superfamily
MNKSDILHMPEYFDRYIALADDVPVLESLNISLQELENAPIDKWKALGEQVYAPGKWTIKDILQHCIDTERVFVYRTTAIARGDKQRLLGFDENEYADHANAHLRTIDDLMEELILVRKLTIMMFTHFTSEMLQQQGFGQTGQYGPLALGFIIAGHQRWHFRVLEERYYPLLG